jgi:hypothetical protein
MSLLISYYGSLWGQERYKLYRRPQGLMRPECHERRAKRRLTNVAKSLEECVIGSGGKFQKKGRCPVWEEKKGDKKNVEGR